MRTVFRFTIKSYVMEKRIKEKRTVTYKGVPITIDYETMFDEETNSYNMTEETFQANKSKLVKKYKELTKQKKKQIS